MVFASASSLKRIAPFPLGVSSVTTWLNLRTTGCCACAPPRSASAVTAPASCTSFMVFPPVAHAGSNGLLRNLDEVAVRIAYVHRADRSPRAGLHHRSLNDRHVARGKASDHLRERQRRDKADVERAGQGRCRPGLDICFI